MQATLTFNLPEENSAHLAAVHGTEWALVASRMFDRLCKIYNTKDHNVKEGFTPEQTAKLVLDEMTAVLDEYNLSLDMVE